MKASGVILAVGLIVAAAAIGVRQYLSGSSPFSAQFVDVVYNPGAAANHRWAGLFIQGRGPHAVFRITAKSTYGVEFGVDRVEKRVGNSWLNYPTPYPNVTMGRNCYWSQSNGGRNYYVAHWYYVFPWPRGLDTNTPWRLRFWVKRAPPPLLHQLNQRLHREIFRAYGKYYVRSSVVFPSTGQESLELTGTNTAVQLDGGRGSVPENR
jgi:hypothetical protein